MADTMEDFMELDAYHYESCTDDVFYSVYDRKRHYRYDDNKQKRAESSLKMLFDDLKDIAYAMEVPFKGLQRNCGFVVIDGIEYDLTDPMQGSRAMHDIMWRDIPDNVVVKTVNVNSVKEMLK